NRFAQNDDSDVIQIEGFVHVLRMCVNLFKLDAGPTGKRIAALRIQGRLEPDTATIGPKRTVTGREHDGRRQQRAAAPPGRSTLNIEYQQAYMWMIVPVRFAELDGGDGDDAA